MMAPTGGLVSLEVGDLLPDLFTIRSHLIILLNTF